MGDKAIPFLLAEIEKGTKHLFLALESIVDDNPAEFAQSDDEARHAWTKWSEERNFY